jgi:chorismate dehydratase
MRIALVDYLNAAPLWWGLREGRCPEGWELCFETPARCAEMLRSGEAKVGIIPSLEFDRASNLCMPVPLGVACAGNVRSVLLFSGGPLSGARRVLLDPTSRTSHGLVRILLRSRSSFVPEFREEAWGGEDLGETGAALVIGDRALKLSRCFTCGEVMDLGAAWFEETGLPFVFAVWAAHKLPDEQAVAETLLQSYLYGMERIEEIVTEYAPKVGLPESDVREYLTENLHYPLREPDYEGLREFWQRAALERAPEEEGPA